MSRRIARPYAAALFQVLEKQGLGTLREAEQQLAAVTAVLAADRRLPRVFEVPSVPPAAKRRLMDEIARAVGAGPVIGKLLAALVQHYRLRSLPEVTDTFREMIDAREGVVRGTVHVPTALTPEQSANLKAALAAVVGSRVELAVAEEPELLAGFVVRIGSRVYDGSLRSQLAKFARSGGRQ